MRRLALLSLIGSAVWFGSPVGSAHLDVARAAPSTPVPSVTPVGVPSAAHIMDLMMRAWQAAASVQFTLTQRSSAITSSASNAFSSSQKGDIDWAKNPPVFQMQGPTYTTVKVAGNQIRKRENEIQIYDQNLLAIKLGNRKWTCNHFLGYGSLPGSPVWDETSPYGLDFRNLGTAVVDGVPAWHLQTRTAALGKPGTKSPVNIAVRDYYASTSTYLPLEIHFGSRYVSGKKHGSASTTLRFSNFGAPVQVALPSACAGL